MFRVKRALDDDGCLPEAARSVDALNASMKVISDCNREFHIPDGTTGKRKHEVMALLEQAHKM